MAIKIHPGIYPFDESKEHHHSNRLVEKMIELAEEEDGPIYDYGCADSFYVDCLRKNGFKAWGFEGTVGIRGSCISPYTLEYDLTVEMPEMKSGLAMSIEVAEHIDWQDIDKFLDNITRSCRKNLLITWAVVGQGGRRHVSELNQNAVIKLFNNRGFKFDDKWSNETRSYVGDEISYMKNTIYLFRK